MRIRPAILQHSTNINIHLKVKLEVAFSLSFHFDFIIIDHFIAYFSARADALWIKFAANYLKQNNIIITETTHRRYKLDLRLSRRNRLRWHQTLQSDIRECCANTRPPHRRWSAGIGSAGVWPALHNGHVIWHMCTIDWWWRKPANERVTLFYWLFFLVARAVHCSLILMVHRAIGAHVHRNHPERRLKCRQQTNKI